MERRTQIDTQNFPIQKLLFHPNISLELLDESNRTSVEAHPTALELCFPSNNIGHTDLLLLLLQKRPSVSMVMCFLNSRLSHPIPLLFKFSPQINNRPVPQPQLQ